MKNKIIIGGFLLLSFISAYGKLSYVDSIQSSLHTSYLCMNKYGMSQMPLQIDKGIIQAQSLPLYIALMQAGLKYCGKDSQQLQKIMQYNAWYNKHDKIYALDSQGEFRRYNYHFKEGFVDKVAISQIAEPGIFLAADHAFEKLADSFSQTEVGKTIAQTVPEGHHQFIKKNGTVFLSAAVARGIGTVLRNEPLSENAKTFGKNAFTHLGSNTLEEYVVNPFVDHYFVEDNTKKECAKFAANTAAMSAAHLGLHIALKALGAA